MVDFSDIDSSDFKDEPTPSFEDTNVPYMQYLEARGAKNVDPMSTEGLALQAKYLLELENNTHPLDILRKITVNPFAAIRDRISAAKAIMEYTMVKSPSKVEVSDSTGGQLKIDRTQLAALSDEEVEQLLKLLSKASKE
jgi:hypothetical protein